MELYFYVILGSFSYLLILIAHDTDVARRHQ